MASNLFMSTSSKLTTNTTSGGEKATVVDLLVKCGNEIKNQSVAALGKTLCKYESSSRSPLELESQQQQQSPCMLKSAVSSLCRAASNTLLLPSACPNTAPTSNTPSSNTSSSSASSSPFIDPSELMKNLCEISKKPCVILLDCRPYTEFNNKHIKVISKFYSPTSAFAYVSCFRCNYLDNFEILHAVLYNPFLFYQTDFIISITLIGLSRNFV